MKYETVNEARQRKAVFIRLYYVVNGSLLQWMLLDFLSKQCCFELETR